MAQNNQANHVLVLDEVNLDEFEHTAEEMEEYAQFIGIDTELDRDLMWIARAGLKAPLPAPWRACSTVDDDDIWYFNFETGDSVWEHPCDEYYRELVEKSKAERCVLALTLATEPAQDGAGLLVSATNLAGVRAAETTVPDACAESFASVYQRLLEQLELPQNAGIRLLLADCSVIGYSSHCESVAKVFKLACETTSQPLPSAVAEAEPAVAQEQEAVAPNPKVALVVAVKQQESEGQPMLVTCTRLDGEVVCCLPVEDAASTTFKKVEKRLRAAVRLGPNDVPKFVLQDGTCITRENRRCFVTDLLLPCDGVRHGTHLVVVAMDKPDQGVCRVTVKDVEGKPLLLATGVPARNTWINTQKYLMKAMPQKLAGSMPRFALEDGSVLTVAANERCMEEVLQRADAN